MLLEDAREYIFPLLLVPTTEAGVVVEGSKFLGTAFFVSRQGDAITAGHNVPPSEKIPEGQRLVAVVVRDGKEQVCWVTHAAVLGAWDLALVHVNLTDTRHFQIADAEVHPGTDVEVLGITDHEVWGGGKEMRILKGHVSLGAKQFLELSCLVPPGMSGSPVIVRGRVVACATESVRSGEQLEDSTEETRETKDGNAIIRRIEVRRVFLYGRAVPFSACAGVTMPVLDHQALIPFVTARNA